MTEQSLTTQAIFKAFMLALLVIPTAISIFVALEVKNVRDITNQVVNGEPQIVCFDPDVCAIEVQGKWYRIDGVISMDETVPDEYRLHDLVEAAEQDRDEEIVPPTE